MEGEVFMGKYEVRRLLGEGGMGRVYLAHQYDLRRNVVVKVMHEHVAADPLFRERFESEMLLMAQFQHPFAVTLLDASLHDPNGPCIVMEYIRGITLDKLLAENSRPLSPGRVQRILGQICEVLYAAHQQGIIHRDLKPANIMVLDRDSPFEKIKIMDFGLARLRGRSVASNSPGDSDGGSFVGTPRYMSPEQIRGENIDHRADIYNVGLILYQLLTGRHPFERTEMMDIMLAHAFDPVPSFREAGVVVPRGVEELVLACLAKDADDRPPTVLALAEQFEKAVKRGGPRSTGETTHVMAPTKRPPTPVPVAATDPCTLIRHLEAWMPDSVAHYKLFGFVQHAKGAVVENKPGKMVVRLDLPGQRFSWFGWRRRERLEMELLLQRDPRRSGILHINVLMRSLEGRSPSDPVWRDHCNRIFCDLRGYLMQTR
ncbi:MAG: hypothetical protein KatS3mg105_2392 [Gemmatales bacterium]|nr:MAG: hypothetical protein KatS3mg105_2392 [Gemmatales bacterium]